MWFSRLSLKHLPIAIIVDRCNFNNNYAIIIIICTFGVGP